MSTNILFYNPNTNAIDKTVIDYINPNLLIDGGGVIWSGETSFTNPKSIYTADMWMANNLSLVEKAIDGIKLVGTGNIRQFMENIILDKELTFSFSINDKRLIVTSSFTADTSKEITVNEEVKVLFTHSTQKNAGCIIVSFIQDKTRVFKKSKLEYGKIATTYIPKSYQEELKACQYYYEKKFIISDIKTSDVTTTAYILQAIHIEPKRVKPTFILRDWNGNLNYVSRATVNGLSDKQAGRVYSYPTSYLTGDYELISDTGTAAMITRCWIEADARIY